MAVVWAWSSQWHAAWVGTSLDIDGGSGAISVHWFRGGIGR